MYAKRAKELLRKLREKEITLEQLDEMCYQWSLEPEVWADLTKVSIVPEMPRDLKLYYDLPLEKRARISQDFFLQFKSYFNSKSRAYCDNLGKVSWLKKMRKNASSEAAREIDRAIVRFNMSEGVGEAKESFVVSDELLEGISKAKEVFDATLKG